jgi:Mg-chelatase subunit ChlD
VGLLRVPLGTREARRVVNPEAGAELVRTKGPIDVIVVMDTTGSMQGSIDSLRDNAISSIRRLREKTDDVRMAVVTFRDLSVASDAGHFLTRGFTSDLEAQFAFMRGLKADGGGDTPEDQLDGLSRAIALWETEPQDEDRVPAKIIVTITDAPAKEPDKAGNTFASLKARALAVDPAHIYPILVGGDARAAEHAARLASDTGGRVLAVKTGNEVADALLAAVDTAVVVHGGERRARGRTWLFVLGAGLVLAAIGAGLFALRQRRRALRGEVAR